MGLNLQEAKVSNAVSLILSLAKSEKKEDVLSDEFEPVQLQIGVKKIPKEAKRFKLKLPQPIAKPDADICLFVKDLDKKERDTEPTIIHFQNLLSKKGVTNIKEIIPIKSLKTDYKPYEAKWNLSNAYDIYLADERVVASLPGLLGKYFYGRKRAPSQINMLATDLKGEISKAINLSTFTLANKGSSSMATVGHSGMNKEDITANIIAAVSQISEGFPGTSENIKQLSIKVRTLSSIPIYLTQGGPQDITIKAKRKRSLPVEIDELSTLPDGKVAVYPDGKVVVLKGGESLKQAQANERKSKVAAAAAAKKKKAAKRNKKLLKGTEEPPKKKKKLNKLKT